jgi:uncharacterized protein (TIGR00251 family)
VVKKSVEKSCTFAVKAIPNAPRSEVVGWLGEAIKIKVHAPALEGRANNELCRFLADKLGLPRQAISLLRGEASRQKTIHVDGLDLDEVKTRLGLK